MRHLRAAFFLFLAGPLLSGCGGGGERSFGTIGAPTNLTCVPYAEKVTGIVLPGDAYGWWREAAGRYQRSRRPEPGSVLVFRPTGTMPLGHVAVVAAILSPREILVDHANWVPYRITTNQPVVDVSGANDWSEVRVWYPPVGGFGNSVYRVDGFVLPRGVPVRESRVSAR
ncbi:MAG: CHAP domain-containing protein [Acetobacteraceae bacterium]